MIAFCFDLGVTLASSLLFRLFSTAACTFSLQQMASSLQEKFVLMPERKRLGLSATDAITYISQLTTMPSVPNKPVKPRTNSFLRPSQKMTVSWTVDRSCCNDFLVLISCSCRISPSVRILAAIAHIITLAVLP